MERKNERKNMELKSLEWFISLGFLGGWGGGLEGWGAGPGKRKGSYILVEGEEGQRPHCMQWIKKDSRDRKKKKKEKGAKDMPAVNWGEESWETLVLLFPPQLFLYSNFFFLHLPY